MLVTGKSITDGLLAAIGTGNIEKLGGCCTVLTTVLVAVVGVTSTNGEILKLWLPTIVTFCVDDELELGLLLNVGLKPPVVVLIEDVLPMKLKVGEELVVVVRVELVSGVDVEVVLVVVVVEGKSWMERMLT